VDGLKPTEKPAPRIFLEFRRFPIFFPTTDIMPEDGRKLGEQSSRTGSGLPIIVPLTTSLFLLD
jgi:hypothetical protein